MAENDKNPIGHIWVLWCNYWVEKRGKTPNTNWYWLCKEVKQEREGKVGMKYFSIAQPVLQTNYIKLLRVGNRHQYYLKVPKWFLCGANTAIFCTIHIINISLTLSTKVLEFLSLLPPPGQCLQKIYLPLLSTLQHITLLDSLKSLFFPLYKSDNWNRTIQLFA